MRTTVYNPLDHSQIAFIPTGFDSDTDSCDDSNTIGHDSLEAQLFHHYNDSGDLSKMAGYSSSANSLNSTRSLSSQDAIEIVSQASNAQSLSSNVVEGVRYKIVLKLTSREIKLIRDSWDLMLSEEKSDETKSSSFFTRVFKTSRSSSISHQQAQSISEHSIKTKLKRVPTATSTQSNTTSSKPPAITTTTISNSMSSSLFCAQFYSNFLSMDPDLEKAFPSLKHQATAFAGVLTMAINNLEDLTAMEAYLNNLGKRHARVLGIHPPQFELMGIALLRTIRDRFGVYCTFELEETWARLYSYLANSILQFGIDPILKVDFIENELHLPVPNLIEHTPITKISLSEPPQSQIPHGPSYKKNSNNVGQPLQEPAFSGSKPPVTKTASSSINDKSFFTTKLKGRTKGKTNTQSGLAQSEDCIIM
ncbi:unnamed protein product [Kluyveromyces dobzhanskii CBS 2104]|uniref:WGS project CCBQ000000000 data, contig 00266 n=1 Tax=Kluyveromyces dobzhanskii CBS 2104 TaxID=1427455 RepID=A0A0A8L4W3_9SACH|nr:unnamed protein product [Kluyveromyces dobzhanskii CBS 2104]